jgi:hypothetical protein
MSCCLIAFCFILLVLVLIAPTRGDLDASMDRELIRRPDYVSQGMRIEQLVAEMPPVNASAPKFRVPIFGQLTIINAHCHCG